MDPEHSEMYLRLWTDLTRRARPGYVAPAASLLAFAAWQCGNGALANIALERALADDPRYSMARLLRGVLDAAVPPRLARLPMTPQDVAASYADSYGDQADDGPGEDGEDVPEFGDADFGDPGHDDCEAGDTDEEEIPRQGRLSRGARVIETAYPVPRAGVVAGTPGRSQDPRMTSKTRATCGYR